MPNSPRSQWHRNGLYGRDRTAWTLFSPETFARQMFGNFSHFVGPEEYQSTTAMNGFTVTADGAGTIVLLDRVGGWLQLLAGVVEGQGVNLQQAHETFLPAADRDIHFGCRIELDDATESQWFAGLAITDTDVDVGTIPADIVGYWSHDGDLNLDFQAQSTASGVIAAVDTGQDLADNTAIELGFTIHGITDIHTWINGREDTTAYVNTVANIPITEMAMVFSHRTGEGVTNSMKIDWYNIVQCYV